MKKTVIVIALIIVGIAFAFSPKSKDGLRKELVKFPISDQRIIFKEMKFEDQRNLWYNRLIEESKYHSALKKEMLVSVAKAQLNPQFNPDGVDVEFIKVFGYDEAKRILTTLYLHKDSQVPSKFYTVEGSINNTVFFCETCHVQGINWCSGAGGGAGCVLPSCTPSYSNYGCGSFFLYSCDGHCDYVGIQGS